MYRLQLSDGTEITLPIIENVQELGAAIEQHIIQREFAQLLTRFEANKPAVFPGLCLH